MMPQFRRIGGMLADEVPVDEAALHAAILAINQAIDNQVLTFPNFDNSVKIFQKYHASQFFSF